MAENRPLFLFIESSTCGIGEVFARKAHELGYAPVLIASDPQKYDFSHNTWLQTRTCDTYSTGRLQRLISDLSDDANIAGIFTSSEFFLAQSATLALSLGLPGPNSQIIKASRDKTYSRRVVAMHGIDDLEYTIAQTPTEAAARAVKAARPVMVSPSRGSGSGRVKLCKNEAEVRLHVAKLLLSTPELSFLVEDFMPGQEFSIQLFDGMACALVAKHRDLTTHCTEIGYDFPASISTVLAERLGQFAQACANALGITWGPAHVELRSDGRHIHLVEIHPRLIGGMLPFMIQAAGGPDLVKATIQKVTGRAYSLNTAQLKSAALRFIIVDRLEALLQVSGIEAARAIPDIESAWLHYELPLKVVPTNNVQDIVGHILAISTDLTSAVSRIEQAMSCLRFEISDAESPTLH